MSSVDLGFFSAAALPEEEEPRQDTSMDAENTHQAPELGVEEDAHADSAQTARVNVSVSVADLEDNAITRLANTHWLFKDSASKDKVAGKGKARSKGKAAKHPVQHGPVLERAVIEQLWAEMVLSPRATVLLDMNQYLEKYLWPTFMATASADHVLSIAAIINEKCRDRVIAAPFAAVTDDAEKYAVLWRRALNLLVPPKTLKSKTIDDTHSNVAQYTLLVFLINAFQRMENITVRSECARLVGISIWHSLRDADKLETEFNKNVGLRKAWNRAEKKSANASEEDLQNEQFFLSSLIKLYFKKLASIENTPTKANIPAIEFCERVLELLTDLLGQLTTRRFLTVLLKDHYVAQTSRASNLAQRGMKNLNSGTSGALSGATFVQLLELYELYEDFEVDVATGEAVSRDEAEVIHAEQLQNLQKLCFVKYRSHLEDFALSPIGDIGEASVFKKHIMKLVMPADENEEGGDDESQSTSGLAVLHGLCLDLGYRITVVGEDEDDEDAPKYDASFLADALCRTYCKKTRQLDLVNAVSVYPNETDLFDDQRAPDSYRFQNMHCLPIPKLNLQFLTMHDYLLRNFNLFRLETAYEIRQDVEDAVKRLQPRYMPDVDALSGSTAFAGWSRMACPIERFEVTEVGAPAVGETKPSFVLGELSFVIGKYNDAIRREWESLKRHDVLFLITIEKEAELPSWSATAEVAKGKTGGPTVPFRKEYGIKSVRGCMIVDALDQSVGEDSKNGGEQGSSRRLYNRTLRVSLDANQYERDMQRVSKKEARDVHQTFNIVLRRKASENNFKSVVECLRDLMQSSDIVVPEWLHDVVLGYGDPSSAVFTRMKNPVTRLDFRDTFLDYEHAVASFPGKQLQAVGESTLKPPFVLTFPNDLFEALAEEKVDDTKAGKRKRAANAANDKNESVIKIETYKPHNMGPFVEDAPKLNMIKFTPKQVEAIHAGSSPGLTLIVGPPGTGKTDTTVQIIANIYHNFPNEKTLLITHSNQALNQLFEKIVDLDIDQRHVLRLGQGAEDINSEESWSKYGRVNSFLEKRIQLLAQVDALAATLSIPGAHGYTCETAQNFFLQYIVRYWDQYQAVLKAADVTVQKLNDFFPFHYYFSSAPTPLFYEGQSLEDAVDTVEGCYRHISKIFTELEDIRAFELLRNNHDRSNYLLIKEAKIIALTCTHAAMKRKELVALGFKYHNVIMEEAAQVLEVETFIPLLLQSADQDTGLSHLKRVVLIGDHHQLPPVVHNNGFQKYGNMEQSLFARLIRLGVPAIELDQQGRCRSGLADLFRWNYSSLDDLELIKKAARSEFTLANPGFAFDYQFINVEDYQGKGETEPIPHFIQNLGEAEYVVATYQYMRLLGYPASKISILTTYNGQKALIEDVLEKRCRWNPLFGLPADVATVDKFQGQQNDFILLSLVRTKTAGHLRDVRRLIVALSRARLGMYIFGRQNLFENSYELQEVFKKLLKRPSDGFWLRGQELWDAPEFSRLADDFGVVLGQDDEWVAEDNSEAAVFKIANVAHMGSYVHQMIIEQVEWMKMEKAKKAQLIADEESKDDENEDENMEASMGESGNGDGPTDAAARIDGESA
ncbi:hypothetical protein HDU77_000351 [Chytriomyces hyalinus]|nr:hypothetical protein HDU77_000351 [Chytriomyces hyalinus]